MAFWPGQRTCGARQGLCRWNECVRVASRALGGILSGGRASKMEIPAESKAGSWYVIIQNRKWRRTMNDFKRLGIVTGVVSVGIVGICLLGNRVISAAGQDRSEERRVGKECRSRW